mmetsp:Transcript_25477/g.60601  ORF Transcript_25477/g.60601 Transcript_25477/m.60601 type:complete len:233 (-) Transcript_25477:1035-1733(-)
MPFISGMFTPIKMRSNLPSSAAATAAAPLGTRCTDGAVPARLPVALRSAFSTASRYAVLSSATRILGPAAASPPDARELPAPAAASGLPARSSAGRSDSSSPALPALLSSTPCSCSASTGLVRTASKAERSSGAAPPAAAAVTATSEISREPPVLRVSLTTSSPDRSGMKRSSSARSTPPPRSTSSASLPPETVRTSTSTLRCDRQALRTARLTASWLATLSSATSTFRARA